MESTNSRTIQYIKEHPHIKSCLAKGLINYSSLARMISKDLRMKNKSTIEAILIAARRYHSKLVKENGKDTSIRTIIDASEIQIKTKISVVICPKSIDLNFMDKLQKEARSSSDTFHLLEGSDSYTVICPERYAKRISNKLHHGKDLVMINYRSPKEIQTTKGVIAYLTALFAENGVNIIQFYSCWTDTIFLIKKQDLQKVIGFLDQ